jgi:hypothetical protein
MRGGAVGSGREPSGGGLWPTAGGGLLPKCRFRILKRGCENQGTGGGVEP